MKKIILLTVLLLIFITGCQNNKIDGHFTTTTGKLSNAEINQLDVDEDIKEIAIDATAEQLPASSKDKIQQSYESQEISREEWAMLTFISSYYPEKLPTKYQGEKSTNLRNQLQEAKWWLNENYNNLDDNWKERFEPFYVLPDDPQSIFNIQDEDVLDELLIIPSVNANGGWESFQAQVSLEPVDRRVQIFYKTEDKSKALMVNETIHKAWMMHESLLGIRPDKMVYLYIKPMSDGAGEAEMKDNAGNEKRCVIGLNRATGKKEMQSTAAHELFHCFQFYIPLKYEQEDTMWLMEATASWVESYVYPDYNIEWMYLPYHFKNLHNYMITHNGDKEYSGYTWYYFLTQFTGDINQIKGPLFNAKTMGGRAAATSINHFDALFAEYALWNWNKLPVEGYIDTPKFPTGTWKGYKMNPQGENLESGQYSTQDEFPFFELIYPLSMSYRELIFPSDDVKKVVFDFDKKGNSVHQRWALIKIGDSWHLEDWTEIKERKFCRTREEEMIKAVVLIFSNSDTNKNNNPYDETFKMDTRGECNPEWHGYTRWYYSDSWSGSIDGGALLSGNMDYTMSTSYTAYETLVYDDEEDEFVIKDQFINFYRSEQFNSVNLNDCGTMNKGSRKTWKGTASKLWDINNNHPSDSDAPVRMKVDWNDPAKYEVDVSIVPGDEFITYSDADYSIYKPCQFEGLFTPVGGQSSSSASFSKNTNLPDYPNDIFADLSEDGNSIRGYVTTQVNSGEHTYPMTIEVNYRYD